MTSYPSSQRLGTKVIHLETVDSTNNYAAKLLETQSIGHGTVIMADEQTKGRGQRGSLWQSEPGMNLQFSFLLRPSQLKIEDQKVISQIIGICLVKTLKVFGLNALIKWPNDIYVENSKIAGVLIENSIKSRCIATAIVGIGLNVNQKEFSGLNATSMRIAAGRNFILQDVLNVFADQFEDIWSIVENQQLQRITPLYYSHLLGYQDTRMYQDAEGLFEGKIEGIDEEGKLLVLKNKTKIVTYDLKEINFLF